MSSKDFGTLPPNVASSSIKPFVASTPEKDVEAFKTLLKLSKTAAPTYESLQEDGKIGVTDKWMKTAKERWEGGFDW